jgi:hypothetical protein
MKVIDKSKKEDHIMLPKGPKPLSQILSKEQIFKMKFVDEKATDLFDNEKDKENALSTLLGCFVTPSADKNE